MEIGNLGDFIHALKSIHPSHGEIESPSLKTTFGYWYRGERSYSWSLRPKVFRDRYDERDLTNRFRVLAKSRHANLPGYNDYGLFLSVMQHYGLPTRLLDWSTSPLVALYFAVRKYIYNPLLEPIDAAVVVLNPYILNNLQIGEATTPSIEGPSIRKFLRAAFTSYGPSSSNFDKSRLPDYLTDDADKTCAVMGAETDIRIFAQQGCFTIHTAKTPLVNIQGAPEYLHRINIPSTSVRNIANELLLCGYRNSTLFPDLTNLADDLQARY
jgi:hypothetical protein